METFERARLDAYFTRIAAQFAPAEPSTSFLITHLLAERPAFVRAVAAMTRLAAVLPKPKSIHPAARHEVEQTLPVDTLSRDLFKEPDTALNYFESRAAGEPVCLLDVGGYFAPTIAEVHSRFTGRLAGIVEDTQNGHRRYQDLDKLPCPVVSVARSPLKDPEDYLVGQSVVFSTEAVMRGRGDILHGRPALVIGFGKLGSSIARLLHAKGVQVTVFDVDPVRRTQALSQGFTPTLRLPLRLSHHGGHWRPPDRGGVRCRLAQGRRDRRPTASGAHRGGAGLNVPFSPAALAARQGRPRLCLTCDTSATSSRSTATCP
ncbi:hypothetical protein [Streptomyces sp. NPDC002785]|uniref:hypothetical protein n=1 Tax=Streptomyces sp. NPDC002785 TaxID=3154543 RepID=UPI00331A3171